MLLSTALDGLYEKVQELGKQRFWFLFLGLIFIVTALINGVGIVPEEAYQRLSQDPFTTRTDIHFNNYWQETILLPIIAYYLGLTGTITFNALTFIMIVGAYALFAWLTFNRWGAVLSLIASTLLITSPLSTVLLSWLGTPDGLTVALTIPFLFTQSGALVLVLAILGAANHPAFIVATLEVLVLRWAASDKINLKHIILTALGILIGYGIVNFFLNANGIDMVSRFDFMQLKSFEEWARMNLEDLPITLFSLYNVHWLIFPICMIMFFKKDRAFFKLALLILLLNYGIVFFTLDTTRIYVLTSWAVLFVCIFHSYKLAASEAGSGSSHQKQYLQALILVSVVSLFTPRFFSWVGEIHVSPFYKIVEHFIQKK